jgi:hypothetical protein
VENIYRAIFKTFEKYRLKYLLMGGVALVLYGSPRSTFDIDIIIEKQNQEIEKLLQIIKDLHFMPRQPTLTNIQAFKKLKGAKCITYSSRKGNMQIDIFLKTKKQFDKLYKNKNTITAWNIKINLASLDDIKKMKKKAARDIDKLDIKFINAIKKIAKNRRK